MRLILSILLVLVFAPPSFGQGSNPLDKWTKRLSSQSQPLADLRANRYDPNSLSNPYGAGSRYKPDGLMNPYSRHGSRYSNESATNPYATRPPKIYSESGEYRGELSTNRYSPDSTSNPYGRYGSRYSPDSINNPYGAGSRYLTRPLYVYPQK